MKKICTITIILFVVAIFTPSCSLFKNVTRNVQKTDSTVVQNNKIIDKSTSVITEKLDTAIHIKKDSVSGSIVASKFDTYQSVEIDTTFTSKSGSIDLGITYNKKTKSYDFSATSKPQTVNIAVNKTTTTQNNIVSTQDKKTTLITKNTESTSKSIFTPTSMIIGACVLILLLALIWFVWTKFGSKII